MELAQLKPKTVVRGNLFPEAVEVIVVIPERVSVTKGALKELGMPDDFETKE